MRNSVRLFGAAAVATGLMAMGSPAFAGVPEIDLNLDKLTQAAEATGGNGGNGGNGGTAVGLGVCLLNGFTLLGEGGDTTCGVADASGGDGGAGGEANVDQDQSVKHDGKDDGKKKGDNGKHHVQHQQSYEAEAGQDGKDGQNG